MKLFKEPRVNPSILLKELYVLLKGGLPLPKALEVLASQKEEASEKLLELKMEIERGEELSKAFLKSGLFPRFVCEMLVAAQTEQGLEELFLKTSEWLSQIESFKSRLSNALIYPSLVIFLSIFAIIFVLQFIVPKLEKILVSFGGELPFITRCLVVGAKVFSWGFILGLPLFSVFFFFLIKRKGWEPVHEFFLKVPVLGKLWIYFDLSRWSYTTSLLIDSGVVLPRAVFTASESCQNLYLRKKLLSIIPFLEEGRSLSYYLKKFAIIPSFVSELVAIGEETGTLSEMLQNSSELLVKEADVLIERTLKWIEPITILIIALIVAYIVLSVILPIMEISSSVHL